jgi:hypothetical protein
MPRLNTIARAGVKPERSAPPGRKCATLERDHLGVFLDSQTLDGIRDSCPYLDDVWNETQIQRLARQLIFYNSTG